MDFFKFFSRYIFFFFFLVQETNIHFFIIIELKNLTDPHRKFIREGYLRRLWDKKNMMNLISLQPTPSSGQLPAVSGTTGTVQEATENYFFLFNDLLVYAAPMKTTSILSLPGVKELLASGEQEPLHYEGFFLLENAKLRDIPDSDGCHTR
jgi:hypothetical protein